MFCSTYRYVIDRYIAVLAEDFFAHSHIYKGTRVDISIITGSVSREWAVYIDSILSYLQSVRKNTYVCIFLWSVVILCSTCRYVIDTEFGGYLADSHVYKGTCVDISIITGSVSREWAV